MDNKAEEMIKETKVSLKFLSRVVKLLQEEVILEGEVLNEVQIEEEV